MAKKAAKEAAQPRAVTTIGLIHAALGYEAYDPNNEATEPQHIIGWLVNETNGKNATIPITTVGDMPSGWQVRYKFKDWSSPEGAAHADEAT
jgi:hypothetical protein